MILGIVISLFVGAFFGFAMAALLSIAKDSQTNSEDRNENEE